MMFSALHRRELRNAFARAVFRARINPLQAAAAWQDVATDLRAGWLIPTRLNWYVALRQAANPSTQHTPATGCRRLDVLHVAVARELGAQEFLSFDSRQRAVAQLLSLSVKP
jgi:predicted nucleic acid-binding protein